MVAALAFTLFKLAIAFGGTSNYLVAVLERVSLSGLANMTLATVAVSVVPMVIFWSAGTLANAGSSARLRRASMWALGITLLVFYRIIPNIYVITAVVMYLFVRFMQTRAAKRGPAVAPRVGLTDWGRRNRLHEDIEMRSLARAARGAASMSKDGRDELLAKIGARQEKLALPAELARLLALWSATSAFAMGLIVSPATVSAAYMVQTTEGSQTAFMVRGPDDILLIDLDTKTPRVWRPKDVLSWQLCGPSVDDGWWILQPIGKLRDDRNPPCQ